MTTDFYSVNDPGYRRPRATVSEDEAYERLRDSRAAEAAYERSRPVTAERINRIPDWYWDRYPEQQQQVLAGDAELLCYIEERIEDWRTDPLP